MNFGSNAIKYNRQGGNVSFRITRSETAARIAVIDNGIGIPEDKRGKIFEPFHRAGQETGPIQGTGIGLAISKRLAELMRGSVGFATDTDRGSEFWVEIPIVDHETVTTTPVAAPTTDATLTSGARHKIVYVEDNPSNIAFMRDLLQELAAIELLVAPTAEIGVDLIRAQRTDVVIMDINLPGMSGIDATRQLAEWPETKDIPVIALSAAAQHKDTARGHKSDFYRYLTKPVKIDELIGVLEELLAAK
jgi:CheY-like chemotaxis protein